MAIAAQVFTSSGTWTWPSGVTSVTAEAIGGGGGGGTASGNPSTGGGGKGGQYQKATITKGAETQLTITVGTGGAIATAGNPSSVTQSSTTVLLAPGGGGGATASAASTNGAGGTTVNGTAVGATSFAGGNGGTGNYTSGTQGSGAGGGSGGSTGAGGAANVNTAGIAGTGAFGDGNTYAAAGAAGVGNSTAGSNGLNYGSGGSGGKCNSGASKSGGTGGPGVVVLTWTVPPANATLAVTLTNPTISATAYVPPNLSASLSVTLTNPTLNATLAAIASAQVSVTLTNPTISATLVLLPPPASASLSLTLPSPTIVATLVPDPPPTWTKTIRLDVIETASNLTVVATGGPGNPTDVIWMFPLGDLSTTVDWCYLNGSKTTPPTTGLVNAQVTLIKPPFGQYGVWWIPGGAVYPYITKSIEIRPEPLVCLEMEFIGKGNGWTIVRDWRYSQGISIHSGLPGITLTDLIADTGTMHFTLDNSDKNSLRTPSCYSPDHTNRRWGFYLNIGVRLRIGQYVRFTGLLSSIDPVPGKYGPYSVDCEAIDWMGTADRTRLSNLPILVNARGDQVFATLINSLAPIAQPDAVQMDVSPDYYPYTLDRTRDEQTILRDELYRLCTSGLSLIYMHGDGTLVYEARGRRATTTQSIDTFDDSHGFTASRDRTSVVNSVQATIHPRLPATVLVVMYSLPQPIQCAAGTSITILGPWTDPANPSNRVGAVNLASIAAYTDYTANTKADGSGADLTPSMTISVGLSGNSTTFTITLPQDGYITKLQQRGLPLYDYGAAVLSWEDQTSIGQFGLAHQSIDMPYTADANMAQEVAQYTVYNGAFPLTSISGFTRIVGLDNTVELQRSIARQISDRISIIDAVTGVSRPFFINAVDETITEATVQTQWLLAPADVTGYWILEIAGYTELDISTRLAFGQIIGHTDIPHIDVHADQTHLDGVHSDTHTDIVHVDVAHGDAIASHGDTAHTDIAAIAHVDGAHTDVGAVNWHTDTPHTDVAHQDSHQDVPHNDQPHQDAHNDTHTDNPYLAFGDHMDCMRQDSWHWVSGTTYYDSHIDCYSAPYPASSNMDRPGGPRHTDATHSDTGGYLLPAHVDGPDDQTIIDHVDTHSDQHGDSHVDQAHNDYTNYVAHQDVASQYGHGDTPHSDVAHVDSPASPHYDSPHNDSYTHNDTAHYDTAHGDVQHQDIPHQDTPHIDNHSDSAHGDLN